MKSKNLSLYWTPKMYVLYHLWKSPSLYKRSTYEMVEWAVFDQLFNTLGNGIKDNRDLRREMRRQEGFRECDGLRYITKEPLYYVDRLDESGKRIRHCSEDNSLGCALMADKHLSPENTDWWECSSWRDGPETNFPPYPSFNKKYDVVWTTDFVRYGEEWVRAAIRFYEQCEAYFLAGADDYHYAYSDNVSSSKHRGGKEAIRADFEKVVARYKNSEEFSAAFGQEFDGDLDKWLTVRWDNYKEKTLAYIRETLAMLQQALDKYSS